MNTETAWWKCRCGRFLEADPEEVSAARKRCPQCGFLIRPGNRTADPPQDADETRKVNLTDMALMAQMGIDFELSGEWDTSQLNGTRGPKAE